MMVNKEFEDYLLMRVHENDDSRTKDAMAYSLMNGGKRVRPTLLFSVLEWMQELGIHVLVPLK